MTHALSGNFFWQMLYDDTNALDAVRVGRPVKVSVDRGGTSVDVKVTPEARK